MSAFSVDTEVVCQINQSEDNNIFSLKYLSRGGSLPKLKALKWLVIDYHLVISI